MGQAPEIVIGRNPVLECLRAGRRTARRLFLLRGVKGLEEHRAAAGRVPITECDRNQLDRLARGGVHQGVALEADAIQPMGLRDWLQRKPAADALLVVLDGIEDPHNFGAIARSAAAFGAHGILHAKDRSAPLSAAASKAATGAFEHIDMVRATNLARALAELKEAGFWVVGLEADGDKLIWEAPFGGRVALVIGSEGKGMRRLVREACDHLVRIPIQGPISSLNASVSAGIALAEWARQRQLTT